MVLAELTYPKRGAARLVSALALVALCTTFALPATTQAYAFGESQSVRVEFSSTEDTTHFSMGKKYIREFNVKNVGTNDCFVKVQQPVMSIDGKEMQWEFALLSDDWVDGADGFWYTTSALRPGDAKDLYVRLNIPDNIEASITSAQTGLNEDTFVEAIDATGIATYETSDNAATSAPDVSDAEGAPVAESVAITSYMTKKPWLDAFGNNQAERHRFTLASSTDEPATTSTSQSAFADASVSATSGDAPAAMAAPDQTSFGALMLKYATGILPYVAALVLIAYSTRSAIVRRNLVVGA